MTTSRPGEDKFGKFLLDLKVTESCDCCGRGVLARVRYAVQTVRLPDGIKVKDTILHTPSHMGIGITCGCYAKWHRQIAHIESRMKNNAKRP